MIELIDCVGYLGSALVVASFASKGILRLRVLNLMGAFLVTLYAIVVKAYPVVLLDGLIVIVNLYQILKIFFNNKTKVLKVHE